MLGRVQAQALKQLMIHVNECESAHLLTETAEGINDLNIRMIRYATYKPSI